LITRRAAVALLAVTGLALGVVGCNSGGSGDGHPSATVSARSDLVASVGALATTTYAMMLTTPQLSASGTVDPTAGSVTVTANTIHDGQQVTIENLTIHDRTWARIDIGASAADYGIDPTKWLKLDSSLLTTGSLPYDQSHFGDTFDLAAVLGGVLTATRDSAGHYSGRINLTGVAGVASMVPAGSGLGVAATNLPFTAKIDAHGRLVDLKVTGTDPAATFDFGISDYSAETAADPPNDVDVEAAPSNAYALLRADRLSP
jgi:hypothetical protein